jgi:hypothetical protein
MASNFAGRHAHEREMTMKTIVTILGAALLTVSAVQMASAGQRDMRKSERSQQIRDQQMRDSNALFAPNARGSNYGYSDNSRLDALRIGGATAAPAGR